VWKNAEVIVRLNDLECPEPEVVLANLTSETEVRGKVTFFSDSGQRRDEFAILDIPGLGMPVVVRAEKLLAQGRPGTSGIGPKWYS